MKNEHKASVGVQQIGLGGILKQYKLVVPPNQREYSWTADREIHALLQDFEKAIRDNNADYFLGTIVTIPSADSPDTLQVIDGQQRLATTALLLAQIRNFIAPKEPVVAQSINDFLSTIDRKVKGPVTRLRLNLDDNEYFRSLIAATGGQPPEPQAKSNRLILQAFEYIEQHLKKTVSAIDEKDQADVLGKWVDFIEFSAQVILFRVSSEKNAYRMFETLNDRGLKTSQADLVKNYVFGRSGDRLQEAQHKWAIIKGALESLEDEKEDTTVTFLRHALTVTEHFLRESEVYECVQETVRSEQGAISLLAKLEPLAQDYVAIFNPEHDKWSDCPTATRQGISHLNILGIKPIRPLMLAVAAKFEQKEAARAFEKLTHWGVRFLFAGITRSGSVEEGLADVATAIHKGRIKDTNALRNELLAIIPNDEKFRQIAEFASARGKLARYYLRAMESKADGQSATPWFVPNSDQEVITLEHVLPEEDPDGQWPQFNEGTRKADSRRLGNLVLLHANQNNSLKSVGFDKKKSAYLATPYVLTRQVGRLKDWNHEALGARQKQLAEYALGAWPL